MIGKAGLACRPARRSARVFDAVSIGDEMKAAHYERLGARPLEFWATGYPQIDPLFRKDPPPELPLPARRPVVLYAPTWNLGLTSAAMLGDRLAQSGNRSFISGITQSGGWPDATRCTLA